MKCCGLNLWEVCAAKVLPKYFTGSSFLYAHIVRIVPTIAAYRIVV